MKPSEELFYITYCNDNFIVQKKNKLQTKPDFEITYQLAMYFLNYVQVRLTTYFLHCGAVS